MSSQPGKQDDLDGSATDTQCDEDHQNALSQMKIVTKANISSSSSLELILLEVRTRNK